MSMQISSCKLTYQLKSTTTDETTLNVDHASKRRHVRKGESHNHRLTGTASFDYEQRLTTTQFNITQRGT